jgi:putative transposase
MLTVIDEFTRRSPAIMVARRLKSDDVLYCLTELFALHGPPEHLRSDNVLRREAGYPERQRISLHCRGQ